MLRNTHSNPYNYAVLCFISLAALLLSSCAAPQYDSITDAQISSLQKEVDSQMVQFITLSRQNDQDSIKKGSYSQNIEFYNKVETDLTSLELRIEAVPDLSTSVFPELFAKMRKGVENIRQAHQKNGNLPDIVWTPLRTQLNSGFAVMLTYELSLKGVSSPSKPTTTSTATVTAAAKNAPALANQ
ncbi:MAG: hypothetical protein HQK81_02450 [Desulfovibrionaceae bacterium]|nr:hypothetical protein [Desulfovibrionaceae bacterium]MBF0512906.1 hypothetical protein [Desulfovibrionaceae bacterium]